MSEQQIVLAEAMCRVLMRLFGPRVAAAQDERFAFAYCPRCTPPPLLYGCPVCGFSAEEKWRYSLHLKINPETCQRTADRKARHWASKT